MEIPGLSFVRRQEAQQTQPEPHISNAQLGLDIQALEMWIRAGEGTREDGARLAELKAKLEASGGKMDGTALPQNKRALSYDPDGALGRRIAVERSRRAGLPPAEQVVRNLQPRTQ